MYAGSKKDRPFFVPPGHGDIVYHNMVALLQVPGPLPPSGLLCSGRGARVERGQSPQMPGA